MKKFTMLTLSALMLGLSYNAHGSAIKLGPNGQIDGISGPEMLPNNYIMKNHGGVIKKEELKAQKTREVPFKKPKSISSNQKATPVKTMQYANVLLARTIESMSHANTLQKQSNLSMITGYYFHKIIQISDISQLESILKTAVQELQNPTSLSSQVQQYKKAIESL